MYESLNIIVCNKFSVLLFLVFVVVLILIRFLLDWRLTLNRRSLVLLPNIMNIMNASSSGVIHDDIQRPFEALERLKSMLVAICFMFSSLR